MTIASGRGPGALSRRRLDAAKQGDAHRPSVVEELWRYPVKSAPGESVDQLSLDARGVEHDRLWACLASDGSLVSAKLPRRWGRILFVAAYLDAAAPPHVGLRVPGFPSLLAGTPEADHALSRWLREPVTLTQEVPATPRIHRLIPREPGMVPEWLAPGSGGQEMTSTLGTGTHRRRFVDFGAVHLMTTHEARLIEGGAGTTVDTRRFRANLVVSSDEHLAPGDVVMIGGSVRLRIQVPTPRCAIPGEAQSGLDAAPEILRAIGRRRVEIPGLGTAACIGAYAEVLSPGSMRVGDSVEKVAP